MVWGLGAPVSVLLSVGIHSVILVACSVDCRMRAFSWLREYFGGGSSKVTNVSTTSQAIVLNYTV